MCLGHDPASPTVNGEHPVDFNVAFETGLSGISGALSYHRMLCSEYFSLPPPFLPLFHIHGTKMSKMKLQLWTLHRYQGSMSNTFCFHTDTGKKLLLSSAALVSTDLFRAVILALTLLANNWKNSLKYNSMAIGKITSIITMTIWNKVLGKNIFHLMRRQGVLWSLKKSKSYKFGLGSLSVILGSKAAKQYKNPPKPSESLSIHSNCLRGSLVYYVLFS